LTAEVVDSTITFSWNPSTDNIGIMSYTAMVTSPVFVTQTILAKQTNNRFVLTGAENGTYYFMVKATDNNGNVSANSAQISAVVNVVDDTTGTSVSIADFGAYPNPVANTFTLNNASTISMVQIIGINGSVVMTAKNEGLDRMVIDASELAQGLYIYKVIMTDGNVVAGRMIKE
jgi:hypothetical protein